MEVCPTNGWRYFPRSQNLAIKQITGFGQNLAITIVEMEPGGFQHLHSHEPEQTYYILEGRGLMYADGEEQAVKAGDCIFFQSFGEYGLKNTGEGVLRYLSAASPSFTLAQCEVLWSLEPVDS